MSEELLSPKELSKMLNVSLCTILRMIHAGRLPAVEVSTSSKRRLFRVYREDMEAWLRKHRSLTGT